MGNKPNILLTIVFTALLTLVACDDIAKKAIKKMNWEELIGVLSKENPKVSKEIESLSRSFRKPILEAANTDGVFMTALSSSRSLVGQYDQFVKEAPSIAQNADIFRWFAKSQYASRMPGKVSALEGIVAKESNGVVDLVHKNTGEIVARYKDGVLRFSQVDKEIFSSNILQGDMLPNSLYRIRGKEGMEYLLTVDHLGRIQKAETRYIAPNDLAEYIGREKQLNLGREWNAALRTIKQRSRGNDVGATVTFQYADDGLTPQYVHIRAEASGKNCLDKTFTNAHKAAGHEEAIKRFAKRNHIPVDKQIKLLGEMSEDEGLAKLIVEDPDLNIGRWLNTRNHVDQSLLARTPSGYAPRNGKVFAGNVYYFNPHLNPVLKNRIDGLGYAILKSKESISYEELLRLDKEFPKGVPFDKQGFPDFSHVAAKNRDETPIVVDIGQLTGNRTTDFKMADEIYQKMGYKTEENCTWHHIPQSTQLMLVPTKIHELVDHTGGVSMSLGE